MKDVENIVINNARIGFRNFSGKEGQYNNAGNRNFALFIDDEEFARKLQDEGWNIRWLKPRNEDDAPQAFIQVKVAFGMYPPKIVLISNGKKSFLDEESISLLDWAEIDTVDIIIRPYSYEVRGVSGIKAYVKTMYVVLVVDEFEQKYEHLNDSAQDAIGGCGNCDTCDGHCGSPEAL